MDNAGDRSPRYGHIETGRALLPKRSYETPSVYQKMGYLSRKFRVRCLCQTASRTASRAVARGPVPRDRVGNRGFRFRRARACPSRAFGVNSGFQFRSARACPSRTFGNPRHGGGQAPALRCIRGSCCRSARACPSRTCYK